MFSRGQRLCGREANIALLTRFGQGGRGGAKGKAKQALSKYLNSVRQFAKGKYSSYNKTQQQAIDNENDYWLKNEDGLLIGYDPKKIHNVAEPPPVDEEDLPSCPVLK